MKYRLNRNTFRRVFDDATYLENQVNHVRKVLTGRGKAFIDAVSYDEAIEAYEDDNAMAEELCELWMLSKDDADDKHDFEYSTKKETGKKFGEKGDEVLAGIPQPWLTSLEILVTSRCNERCVHCYIPNDDKDRGTMLDKSMIKKAIRQFRAMNGMKINFSGGEPLLHPDIWELLQYSREQNLMLLLNSNMLALSDEMVEKLEELRMFNIQVSLYSMTPEIHDAITRRKGSYERTVKSIRKLVLNNIPVMISCPVMEENRNCVTDVKLFADSLGIDCYFDYIMMAQNNGCSDNLKSCLTPEDTKTVIRQIVESNSMYMETIRRASSYGKLMKMKFARRWSACRIMSNRICMDTDGTFYPCPGWNSMKLGNINTDTLEQIWTDRHLVDELRNTNQHNFPKCKNCELHNFCDMCPVYNFNENSSIKEVSSRFCIAANIFRTVVDELYQKEVFLKTVKITEQGFYATEDNIIVQLPKKNNFTVNAKLFQAKIFLPPVSESSTFNTKVSVIQEDCLLAARRLYEQFGSVCVLNNASAKSPGGSVIYGSGAQEEYLCKCSDYYQAIFQFVQSDARKFYKNYHIEFSNETYPLNADYGCCYVPDVTVFRGTADSGYRLLEEPWMTDIIAVPAVKYPKCITVNGEERLSPEDEQTTLNKIRTIFSSAIINKQSNIVLTAWGCGAFGNPPKHIAELFHKVLYESLYINRFNNVVFSIMNKRNTSEYDAFRNEFAQ